MVTFGPIQEKKQYDLLPQGEYILTLSEIDEVEGQYGDRIVWKFLLAPLGGDPMAYICRDDGEEKTIWGFSDPDIVLGSLAHQFAEALSGRKLTGDSAPPDEDELVGKRLIGYIGHETPKRGKSAGIKRETIVAGTIKPYRELKAKATTTNGAAAPPAAADDDGDRDLVVLQLQKRVQRLAKLDAEAGKAAREAVRASELRTAPLAELEALSTQIGDAITAALDA